MEAKPVDGRHKLEDLLDQAVRAARLYLQRAGAAGKLAENSSLVAALKEIVPDHGGDEVVGVLPFGWHEKPELFRAVAVDASRAVSVLRFDRIVRAG